MSRQSTKKYFEELKMIVTLTHPEEIRIVRSMSENCNENIHEMPTGITVEFWEDAFIWFFNERRKPNDFVFVALHSDNPTVKDSLKTWLLSKTSVRR